MNISGHTHNLMPHRTATWCVFATSKSLPNRVLVRPRRFRQRFINDHRSRRSGVILRPESTPQLDGDTHSGEETRAHELKPAVYRIFRIRCFSFGYEAIRIS